MRRERIMLRIFLLGSMLGAQAHLSSDDLREAAGHYVHVAQPYDADGAAHSQRSGRSLAATQWSPIRIEVREGAVSGLSTSDRSFLMSTLVPAAVSWLQAALQVKPVAGMLTANRNCASVFTSSGTCHTEGTPPVCGEADASGGELNIPAELLNQLEVCQTCTTGGTCQGC